MNKKVIKVEWIDSCSSNTNWSLIEEFDGDIEPIRINSYGVLLQETEDCITIAQNYGINPEQVCNLMTIPKGCIKSITEIEKVKKQMTCKWYCNGGDCSKGLPGTPCELNGCVAWEEFKEDEK